MVADVSQPFRSFEQGVVPGAYLLLVGRENPAIAQIRDSLVRSHYCLRFGYQDVVGVVPPITLAGKEVEFAFSSE
jgi:hypothetical protein